MTENRENSIKDLIELQISEDKMTAILIFKDPGNENLSELEVADLIDYLKQSGIVYGLEKQAIEGIVQKKKWHEPLTVAKGTLPIPGVDAKLEFLFPTEASLKPKILSDGHVDYREVHVIHSVNKNDVLVRKAPLQLGTNGTDVCGRVVDARNGRDIDVSPGVGVYRDPEDDLIIRAEIDGVVSYNSRTDVIEVHDLYIVPHSVDFSSGNLHLKSSVQVREDIKPGFSIETPYNVDVGGVIEHATVICEGTLNVRAGITGDGQRLIEVGGDVHSGYIYNQPLVCGGSVYVDSEIRTSEIESQDEVVIIKKTGVILGGHITATNQVNAANIGNKDGIPTLIEVGVNSTLRGVLQEKYTEIAQLQEKIDKLRNEANDIIEHTTTGVKNIRFIRLQKKWKEYNTMIEPLKKEVADLERDYYIAPAPAVCVSGTVYPGTTIKIKHESYTVKSELYRVKFLLVDNKVQFLDLNP